MPCNIVVYEGEGRARVAAIEPERMLSIVGNEELGPIAERVRKDLSGVVEELGRI